MKVRLLAAALAAACTQFTVPAHAQGQYPTQAVKILVPFSPGSLVDTITRLYADKLSEQLGQAVIAENKIGSGGVIATRALLQSPADGHTLEMVS